MEPFQVAAFALPVANGEIDKGQLGDIAEIGDGENGLKHGLEAAVVTLARQFVHLQKAVVRTLLNLDQVRDLQGYRNLGKIETITSLAILVRHE